MIGRSRSGCVPRAVTCHLGSHRRRHGQHRGSQLLMYATASSTETTSPYLASMSNRFAS